MKVVHVNFARSWRGGERQVALLMKGLQKEKIEQVIICRKGSALEKEATLKNYRFYSLPNRPLSILLQTRIFKNLEEEGFNIIHCHESKAHTFGILGKVFWKTKQKLVIHRRVIFPIKNKPTTAFKYSEKNISTIICISKAVEKSVKKSIGFKNTVVVPSMISLDPPSGNAVNLRKMWNIKSKFIVGYIAALTHEKDHKTFLNTAKHFLDTYNPNVHFVIFGEGPLMPELKEFAQTIGITDNVTFTGFIKEIRSIIPEINVLLFTSVSEGLGTTILDFFVAKRPVVATKSGGAEELITDGVTGFICNPGDYTSLAGRVDFLLKNPEKTKEIVEEANNFATHFSVSKVTLKTIEVYKKVL